MQVTIRLLNRFGTYTKGLGGIQSFKKSIFFYLFNNTVCLEYSLLYGAGIDDSM